MTSPIELPVLSNLFKVLVSSPSPAQVMSIKATESEEQRLDELMERVHTIGLSAAEQRELEMYQLAEHLVELAKIEAHLLMMS